MDDKEQGWIEIIGFGTIALIVALLIALMVANVLRGFHVFHFNWSYLIAVDAVVLVGIGAAFYWMLNQVDIG
jgi:uncharacterized protein YacL